METKLCENCGETKPIKQFNKKTNGKSSKVYIEKVCYSCKDRRHANNNPESLKQSNERASNKRKERRKTNNPTLIASFILQDSRKADKKKGRQNDLTKEFIVTLTSQPCLYCDETDLRMTLDRIDNTIGHLQSNVNPACIRCNNIRGNMPYDAWLLLCPSLREIRLQGKFGNWVGGVKQFI